MVPLIQHITTAPTGEADDLSCVSELCIYAERPPEGALPVFK